MWIYHWKIMKEITEEEKRPEFCLHETLKNENASSFFVIVHLEMRL